MLGSVWRSPYLRNMATENHRKHPGNLRGYADCGCRLALTGPFFSDKNMRKYTPIKYSHRHLIIIEKLGTVV